MRGRVTKTERIDRTLIWSARLIGLAVVAVIALVLLVTVVVFVVAAVK